MGGVQKDVDLPHQVVVAGPFGEGRLRHRPFGQNGLELLARLRDADLLALHKGGPFANDLGLDRLRSPGEVCEAQRNPLGRASRRLALLVLPPQIPGGSAPEIPQVLRLFVELASSLRDRFGLLDGLPAESLDDRAGLLERRLGPGFYRRAVLSKPRVRRRTLADLLGRQGPVELTRRQEITGWPRLQMSLRAICLLPRRPSLSLLCPLQDSVQRVGGLRQSIHEGENILRRGSGGFGRQGLARV